MKKPSEKPVAKLPTTPPTDAEVQAIVFAWARNRLKKEQPMVGEYVIIEIVASTDTGFCDLLMTVATKDWRPYAEGEPKPGIYGRAEEGD